MDKLLITFPFLLLLLSKLDSLCASSSLGPDLCNTTSSCGDISNISYPFRLTTDPITCGDNPLEISCDDNVPTLIYNRSERYYVRSINYNNFTIRLSDASLVPLPNNNTFLCNHSHALEPYNAGKLDSILSDIYCSRLPGASNDGDMPAYNIVIVSCGSPLPIDGESYKWSSYVDGNICSGSVEHARAATTSSYWYATVADGYDTINAEILKDSCRVELMLQTSKPLDTSKGNVSFHEVLESWSYGFELTWFNWFCYRSSHFPHGVFSNFLLLSHVGATE